MNFMNGDQQSLFNINEIPIDKEATFDAEQAPEQLDASSGIVVDSTGEVLIPASKLGRYLLEKSIEVVYEADEALKNAPNSFTKQELQDLETRTNKVAAKREVIDELIEDLAKATKKS